MPGNRMKIRHRLIFGFLLVAVLVGIGGYGNIRILGWVGETVDEMALDIVPCLIAVEDMVTETENLGRRVTHYVSKEVVGEEEEKVRATMQQLGQLGLDYLEHEPDEGPEQDGAQELLTKIRAISSLVNELVNLKKEGASAEELLEKVEIELLPAMEALTQQLEARKAVHLQELVSAEASVSQARANAANAFIISTLGILILAVGFGFVISHSVSRPILKLRDAAVEIGKGRLSKKITIRSKDEIGQLADAFRQMRADLKRSRIVIEDYADGLEKQVLKRTRELEKSKRAVEERAKELSEQRTATLNLLEDLHEANKGLKELDKMKDEFLNVTSHELKTPLTPIMTYLEMLMDGDLGKLSAKQMEALEIISRNTKRLKRLIWDVLDITKLESKKMRFDMGEVRLRRVIRNSIKDMRLFAKGKNITITEQLGRLPKVMVDENRLFQVLTNLLHNAIKFSRRGGEVTVRAKRQKNRVVVSIEDKGIGIAKKNLDKMFQKFFQVDSSINRKFPGTGLGLAISKGIVQGHKGKIWIESELGKGTTVSFTLPIMKKEK